MTTQVPKAPVWSEVVLVGAGALTAWWAVGDQSSQVPPGTQLDYYVRLPAYSPAVDIAIGVIGVVIGVALVVRAKGVWRLPYAGAFLLGAVLGICGRVLTAGGIGANIGAGLVFMIGLPLTAVCIAGLLTGSKLRARSAPQVGASSSTTNPA
ncbi:hypothetical protein NLX83_27090 [Allokutzneria sp. A3M-2-11 16]|uniref:hypothetical protein n=1 Tax=Allokutzneria sp. A3M-2-11 16 TaxID=2962043 RepID=UPI0020B8D63E|nr:hypothetical protein [Allokutzneria sp. A3M-2-11 16]MCP3802946.1 hypothetical protein [Allokutzneria sp. A3M-2-11 16]